MIRINEKPKRTTWVRYCKRCGKKYYASSSGSKICLACQKPRGNCSALTRGLKK